MSDHVIIKQPIHLKVGTMQPIKLRVSNKSGGGAVRSVNRKVGVVELTTADIPDSTDRRYITELLLARLNNIQQTVGATVSAFGSSRPSNYQCVASTGNEVQIQQAVDFVNTMLPNGGQVKVLGGDYTLSNPIVAKSNVTICGEGESSRIRMLKDDYMVVNGSAAIDRFGLESLYFYGNRLTSQAKGAIFLDGDRHTGLTPPVNPPVISNITMRNCVVRDCSSLPIRLFGIRGKTMVTGTEFRDSLDAGFIYCENVIFIGNYSIGSRDNGFSISRGCTNIVCVGNTVENTFFYGIWMGGFAGDDGPSELTCVGNTVKNARYSGICLIDGSKNAVIANNYVDQNFNRPTGLNSHIDGIEIAGVNTTDRASTDITVNGNVIRNASRAAISFHNTKRATVTGNQISNVGTQYLSDGTTIILPNDTTTNVGILSTHLTNQDIFIDANSIIDSRDVPLTNYDIWKINSSTSGFILGTNFSRGMRNQRNQLNLTNIPVEAGNTVTTSVTGPDANISHQEIVKGSTGEFQVKHLGGGINSFNATAGTLASSRYRLSSGSVSSAIGQLTATRSDVSASSLLTLSLLANSALMPTTSKSAPFYIQGIANSASAYIGLNAGLVYKRRTVSNTNVSINLQDYIIAYITSLTAQRTATLPNAAEAIGRTYVIKDETGQAGTNNLVLVPYTVPGASFTDTDVNEPLNTISLSTFLETGTPIVMSTAGTMPGGLTAGTTYYVTRNSASLKNLVSFSGTGVNDASVGTGAWANPSNISVQDTTYAVWTAPNTGDPTASNLLQATNFGFAIPTNAVIEGVQVRVRGKSNTVTAPVYDNSVQLIKGGVLTGNDKSATQLIGSSDSTYTYGDGTQDNWGVALTPADVNASTFGASFQVSSIAGTANVDAISIIVYYTLPNDIKIATGQASAYAGTAIDITTVGSGTVTITSPAQTIDGASSLIINKNNGSAMVYSDGLGWRLQAGIYNTAQTGEPTIAAGTTAQYWRGDKTWQTLDKTAVGLPNLDNTSDVNKPISTATQSALDAKQPLDGTLTALAAFNSNGLIVQSAADTFVSRVITGTANQVTVTNGDGISANPILSLPQNIHAAANPTFAGMNLTALLDVTYSYPMFRVRNSDPTQFAGAAFLLVNTTSTMANQAGVSHYMGINDVATTQGFYAIDKTNVSGGGTGHLMLFDFNANNTTIYSNNVASMLIAAAGTSSVGYFKVGSTTGAPTNTTAGDLTALRFSLGNTAITTGSGKLLTANFTDTGSAAGAMVMAGFIYTIRPTVSSASEYRALYFQNVVDPSTGIAFTDSSGIRAGFFENRIRSDGLITRLTGIIARGMVVDSSSSATVQATSVYGMTVLPYDRPSGTTVGTLGTLTGFAVEAVGSVGLVVTDYIMNRVFNPGSGNTITNLIGYDVPALTRASALNVGVRIALPSGATANYALQLSDTSGVAAGGITLGTDVQFYRSGTKLAAIKADAVLVLNTTAVPSTPTGGGYLYVESGALKFKGSSGTVTVIAPA